jgi:hypothetical protein
VNVSCACCAGIEQAEWEECCVRYAWVGMLLDVCMGGNVERGENTGIRLATACNVGSAGTEHTAYRGAAGVGGAVVVMSVEPTGTT